MAWRMPQILLAMAVVLALGVVSVWLLQDHMGGATVVGLVLVEAPSATAETLLAARELVRAAPAAPPGESGDRGPGQTVFGNCEGSGAAFAPFDAQVLQRFRKRGDTMVLYVPERVLESGDGAAPAQAWSSVLPHRRPEDDGSADRAAGLLATRQQLTGFCIGLVLETDQGLVQEVIPKLLDAAGELPESRRFSLVVLGGPVPGQPGMRHYLRVDLGPWKGEDEGDLTDLLEGGW